METFEPPLYYEYTTGPGLNGPALRFCSRHMPPNRLCFLPDILKELSGRAGEIAL